MSLGARTGWKTILPVAAAMVLGALAAPALADDLVIEGFPPYNNVQITDLVRGTMLVFQTAAATSAKDLSEITSIRITGQDRFNEAEQKRLKQPAEAARLYAAAAKDAGDKVWLARLARLRRIAALDAAGKPAEAFADWLLSADEAKAVKTVLEMRPRKLAAKGSPENKTAIKTLETKLAKVDPKQTDYVNAIKEGLRDLFEREGIELPDKYKPAAPVAAPPGAAVTAAGTSAIVATGTAAVTPSGSGAAVVAGTSAPPQAAAVEAAAKQLADLTTQVDSQPDNVYSTVRANLGLYGKDDLPEALLLLGKSAFAMAQTASEARAKSLLEEAGVALMQVQANYPGTVAAGESLLLAGDVSAALGNTGAAKKAYEKVVEDYKQQPAAEKAQAALAKLK